MPKGENYSYSSLLIMKLTYDKTADALYVAFQDGKVDHTVSVGPGFHADIDLLGKIIGVELLDASQTISVKDLSQPVGVTTI